MKFTNKYEDDDQFEDGVGEQLAGYNCPRCGYPVVYEGNWEICYRCGWCKEEGGISGGMFE